MQKFKTSYLPMLALAGILSMAVGAQADDTVKVNGQLIPQSYFDFVLKQTTARGQKDTPELRSAIREQLINDEVVSQEAENKGLDKNPDVATGLELQRQQSLIQVFIQDYVKNHPISEDTIKAEYEQRKSQLTNQKEYKVRHIDLKTEQDAKNLIEKLKKGTSWEKLAKDQSQDPSGDWMPEGVSPNQVPTEFINAVKQLKKGHFTEAPVQTRFGWHVIRVDDIRPVTIPSYEVAKPQITQMLENANLKKAVDDLRAKAKIE